MSGGVAALPCNIVAAGRGQHKVEVVAKKRKKAINRRCGCVAALPCDIITAGSGQCKVEVAARNRKKVTINRRCGFVNGGVAATAMRHRRGRQGSAKWNWRQIKKR